MAVSKFLKGTMLLTAATFLSKFLGMIYVIPFESFVGQTGGALLSYAYTPYNILISFSTLGVPLAVSKFVSRYNSLGDYETGRRMFRSGLLFMAITGLLAFLVLYFSADAIAPLVVTNDLNGNSIEDVAMVIRMISFALLVIPGMSIVRGFFQGYESMAPTAVSQVIEQVVRIVFLLIAVYIVIEVVDGSIATAVGFASFAAFIGAIASVGVLWFYWKKRKPYLDRQLTQQGQSYQIPMKDLYKELLAYAGPFILVGIATPLYQLIDQFTFNRTMDAIGLGNITETAYAAINLYGHKLVIIPVTLATGLSLALLPAITKSYTEDNHQQLYRQINQALQIIVLLIFPAVVGISILSYEAYATFYGVEGTSLPLTGSLLGWYAPVALFYGLFTVTSSILQGINQQRFAVISLGAGLMIKATLNIPLIHLFEAKGAVFGTGLAVLIAVLLNLWKIRAAADFPYRTLLKRSLLVVILTVGMLIVVLITKWLLGMAGLNYEEGRWSALMVLMICTGVGGLFYLWLTYQTTLLERILGGRVSILDKFLKRKKS